MLTQWVVTADWPQYCVLLMSVLKNTVLFILQQAAPRTMKANAKHIFSMISNTEKLSVLPSSCRFSTCIHQKLLSVSKNEFSICSKWF